jgi:AAA domain
MNSTLTAPTPTRTLPSHTNDSLTAQPSNHLPSSDGGSSRPATPTQPVSAKKQLSAAARLLKLKMDVLSSEPTNQDLVLPPEVPGERPRVLVDPRKTRPITTREALTQAQQLTQTNYFPQLLPEAPLSEEASRAALTQMLADHKACVDTLSRPFSIYKQTSEKAEPQPVRWLWQNRLPLGGITCFDGDHGLGKTQLALQIAAAVSSGTPMPDGSPTIAGGVVIISPYTNAPTAQLPLLKALGADLSRITFLSFIEEPAPEFNTSGFRPFSLPEDLPHLFNAIKQVDARLVIFDPFTSLLSRNQRWTSDRLHHLLADFNQRLIERNVACLLIRNCTARGGHAHPSLLERSEHFNTIALSHLLLAPDPIQPDLLLLSHVESASSALCHTLTLRIQPLPSNPHLAAPTVVGSHPIFARDLIEQRPDTLHRLLLTQQLLSLISRTPDPIHVTTLYASFPNSSTYQIQRALKDLLTAELIDHPSRGLYTCTQPPNQERDRPVGTGVSSAYHDQAANEKPLSAPAYHALPLSTDRVPTHDLNHVAATTAQPSPTGDLTHVTATTAQPSPTHDLTHVPATTSQPSPTHELTHITATSADRPNIHGDFASPLLDHTADTTPDRPETHSLNHPAQTSTKPPNAHSNPASPPLNLTIAMTPEQIRKKALLEMHMGEILRDKELGRNCSV